MYTLIPHVPGKTVVFDELFLLFEMFFFEKVLKMSFQIVQNNKTIEKVLFCPQNRQNDLKQR